LRVKGTVTSGAPLDLTSDQLITIVNSGSSQVDTARLNLSSVTGDVVFVGTTSAIGSGVIVNADISPTAEIAVSKLADGVARQLLQTSADGNEVEWTSDIVIPGTLGVTGTATFSGATTFNNTATFTSGTTFSGTTFVTALEVGNASDTTLERSAAGLLSVEGVVIPTVSSVNTLTNKTLTDPAIIGTILEDVFTITDGAAFEVDPGNGSVQLVTLGDSRTPKATNFVAGESVTLMVNDGTAYTLTWTDATWGSGGVIWAGGTAPTLATTGYTVIQFWKVSTQVYGAYVGDVA
jgi:hypothetical protein